MISMSSELISVNIRDKLDKVCLFFFFVDLISRIIIGGGFKGKIEVERLLNWARRIELEMDK